MSIVNSYRQHHSKPNVLDKSTISCCNPQSSTHHQVLACSGSNLAVDNLVERLGRERDARVVRLGHPARATPLTQRHTLDALTHASDDAQVAGCDLILGLK